MDEVMERAGNFVARVDKKATNVAKGGANIVAVQQPASVASEQYRVLFHRIERLRTVKAMKVIALTSAVSGEGKSVTAANLATVAAASNPGRKVLLVDADLRRPRQHLLLGLDSRPGLGEVLDGEMPVNSAIQRSGRGLYVLTAGAPREDAADLLTGGRMKAFLDEARNYFDEIYLDAPPVLPVADGSYLAGIADGTVVVVRAGQTSRMLVRQALEALAGTSVIGCVLNGVSGGEVPYLTQKAAK